MFTIEVGSEVKEDILVGFLKFIFSAEYEVIYDFDLPEHKVVIKKGNRTVVEYEHFADLITDKVRLYQLLAERNVHAKA